MLCPSLSPDTPVEKRQTDGSTIPFFYRDICNPIRSVYFHYYLFFEKDSEFSFSETKWENLVWKIFELAKLWEESNSLLNLTDLIFENSLILRKEEIKKQRWTNCTLANKNEHWKKFFMLRYRCVVQTVSFWMGAPWIWDTTILLGFASHFSLRQKVFVWKDRTAVCEKIIVLWM